MYVCMGLFSEFYGILYLNCPTITKLGRLPKVPNFLHLAVHQSIMPGLCAPKGKKKEHLAPFY